MVHNSNVLGFFRPLSKNPEQSNSLNSSPISYKSRKDFFYQTFSIFQIFNKFGFEKIN